MEIRPSNFDKNLMVFVVGHDAPPAVLRQLDRSGLGFAAWGAGVAEPFVVIDGRRVSDRDEMLAVEAHEVGHIMTGSRCESTAELFAIALLRCWGHHAAAELLLDRGIVTSDDVEAI
jgi:Zn-dependent protease with chaperone function